jgi:hypothetical protein
MCLLRGWASSGVKAGGPDAKLGVRYRVTHAMNMRAAEAMVSKAPKAMNILPIIEV